jgi:ABC-type glycerol-3-phosphate transport system permease component
MENRKALCRAKAAALNLALLGGALLMLTPLCWMFATALTPNTFLAQTSLIPQRVTLENFTRAWNFPRQFNPAVTMGRFFLNSLTATAAVTLGGILIDSMAAYVLAFKRFPGRTLMMYMALATLMIPVYITVVPDYLIILGLGWLNDYKALIVPFLASGMGILLFRAHFLGLSVELEECAKIDGASDWRVYFWIMMPISKPIVATMGILKAMWSWNQYLWPLIVIDRLEMNTLQQGLNLFKGLNVTQWGYLCAGMSIAIAPMIGVFVLLQRWFIGGLTAGALKG